MPIAAAIPYVIAAASTAATVVSTVQARNSANAAAADSQNAANTAASNTQAVADYNARVDRANEQQVALDSAASIDMMRRDAKVFLSRQEASFAGSGVRVDSGSPLAVRVASAGKLALQEAESHRQAVARMEGLESSAKAGVLEGQAQADAYRIEGQAKADAYHREGQAALLSGAARMLSQGYSFYQGGLFGGAGGAPKLDVPAATPANSGGFDSPTWAGGMA